MKFMYLPNCSGSVRINGTETNLLSGKPIIPIAWGYELRDSRVTPQEVYVGNIIGTAVERMPGDLIDSFLTDFAKGDYKDLDYANPRYIRHWLLHLENVSVKRLVWLKEALQALEDPRYREALAFMDRVRNMFPPLLLAHNWYHWVNTPDMVVGDLISKNMEKVKSLMELAAELQNLDPKELHLVVSAMLIAGVDKHVIGELLSKCGFAMPAFDVPKLKADTEWTEIAKNLVQEGGMHAR